MNCIMTYVPVRFIDVEFIIDSSWAIKDLYGDFIHYIIGTIKIFIERPSYFLVTFQQACYHWGYKGF